ncbi:hypothetical protein [Pauljensenia sp. OF14-1SRA]|uniref:hypothetical protein n=1 Tax=Pauljensenia sp. OF14-1SRA TaxID=2998062 RepID=UPI0022E6BFDD|nr:hypothetical protein [Pauljensenia sp. OF14-1SRA]
MGDHTRSGPIRSGFTARLRVVPRVASSEVMVPILPSIEQLEFAGEVNSLMGFLVASRLIHPDDNVGSASAPLSSSSSERSAGNGIIRTSAVFDAHPPQ